MPNTGQSNQFAPFPSTMWSEILSIRDPHSPEYQKRMDHLIHRYWQPVYSTIRAGWNQDIDHAKDLTQEFFVLVLEGDVFGAARPEKGSFRGYIKTALKNFLLNEKKKLHRIKRGGGRPELSLDFDNAATLLEPTAAGADPEELLDRAWARQLLTEGLADLRERLTRENRAIEADLFEAYDLADAPGPTVRELAAERKMSESEVWKALINARRTLRVLLLERAREYVGTEKELFKELDDLLGRSDPG